MKAVNNYSDIGYSDGDKDTFITENYKGVFIRSCYNRTHKCPEVTAFCEIGGQKYAYVGKSVSYCKKLIRGLQK